MKAMLHAQRSENDFAKSVLSFYHIGTRPGGKRPYPLSCLASPSSLLYSYDSIVEILYI